MSGARAPTVAGGLCDTGPSPWLHGSPGSATDRTLRPKAGGAGENGRIRYVQPPNSGAPRPLNALRASGIGSIQLHPVL
jgi:hypothetical protein